MTVAKLVLSLFPGIDLFGKGFEGEGYCVVRGPDRLLGGDICDFFPPSGVFEGIIGGPPCQDFSTARRCPPSGEGLRMIDHFLRCVAVASPEWFLMENTPRVPTVGVLGYRVQRFNLSAAECGGKQRRLRAFQFGDREGYPLVPDRQRVTGRGLEPCAMATEGDRVSRRTWEDFCELQGLPRSFRLAGWSRKSAYRAVGNGVPVYMARVLAIAVNRRRDTPRLPLCVCDCGRLVEHDGTHATPACRKRMERRRRARFGVSGPGPVTPNASRDSAGELDVRNVTVGAFATDTT